MAPKQVPKGAMSQERVFYTKEWTAEVDDHFIRALAEQTIAGNPVSEGPNRRAIAYAKDRVNGKFATNFNYAFCLGRFRKLHKRYKVFKWLVRLPGVKHDPITHYVECENAIWDFIIREDPLGMAYMLKGETEYDTLKFIFEATKKSDSGEEDVEVIEISSDDHGNTVTYENPIVIDDEIESRVVEENSDTIFWNDLAWYRSDWNNEATCTDDHTSTSMSSNAHVSRDGKNFHGKEKAPPIPRVPPSSGPSSVASSSPFKKY